MARAPISPARLPRLSLPLARLAFALLTACTSSAARMAQSGPHEPLAIELHAIDWNVSPAEAAVSSSPDGGLRVRAEAAQEVTLSHRASTDSFRDRIVILEANVHVEDGATAEIRMKAEGSRGGVLENTNTSGEASSSFNGPLRVVLRVPADATALAVSVTVRGEGSAVLQASSLRPYTAESDETLELTDEQRRRLRSAAIILSTLQYFHPRSVMDRASWNQNWPAALSTLLAQDGSTRQVALQSMVDTLDAGAAVVLTPDETPHVPVGDAIGWLHLGLGVSPFYRSFRSGIEAPRQHGVGYYKEFAIADSTCKRLDASVHLTESAPAFHAMLALVVTPSSGEPRVYTEELSSIGLHGLQADISADTVAVHVGLYARAAGGSITVSDVALRCDDAPLGGMSPRSAPTIEGAPFLYGIRTAKCGSGTCTTISRVAFPEVAAPHGRIAQVELGDGLALRFPLADTHDAIAARPLALNMPPSAVPATSLPVRLAAVCSAWATLRYFYPYWGSARGDWDSAFDAAITEAARDHHLSALKSTLARMTVALGDGHATVYHVGADISGMLPLRLRTLDGRLLITGVAAGADASLVGGEIISINGLDARREVARELRETSYAVGTWPEHIAAIRLGLGSKGAIASLEVRDAGAKTRTALLPYVDRQQYFGLAHEPRPASGSELANGVVYVGTNDLSRPMIQSLATRFDTIRGLIIDIRGTVSEDAYVLLSHLAAKETRSPRFDIPLITLYGSEKHVETGWSVYPAHPHFGGKVVFLVDGRTVSSSETFAQMSRGIGLFVGSQTAGTNGNVATFDIPGGFSVRFTGMVTRNPDGSPFHGKGVVPDLAIAPTIDDLTRGRDPVLDAALATFGAVAHP